MNRVRLVVSAIVLALAGFLLQPPAPALANDPECVGKWRLQGDTFQERVENAVPAFPEGAVDDVLTLHATLVYRWCPNGDLPAKLKPKSIDFAVRDIDRHNSFEAVEFNAAAWEDATDDNLVNPVPKRIPDCGFSICTGTQDIGADKEKWLQVKDNPVWTVFGKIINNNWPDVGFTFKTASGGTKNPIKPVEGLKDGTTIVLSDWKL